MESYFDLLIKNNNDPSHIYDVIKTSCNISLEHYNHAIKSLVEKMMVMKFDTISLYKNALLTFEQMLCDPFIDFGHSSSIQLYYIIYATNTEFQKFKELCTVLHINPSHPRYNTFHNTLNLSNMITLKLNGSLITMIENYGESYIYARLVDVCGDDMKVLFGWCDKYEEVKIHFALQQLKSSPAAFITGEYTSIMRDFSRYLSPANKSYLNEKKKVHFS